MRGPDLFGRFLRFSFGNGFAFHSDTFKNRRDRFRGQAVFGTDAVVTEQTGAAIIWDIFRRTQASVLGERHALTEFRAVLQI